MNRKWVLVAAAVMLLAQCRLFAEGIIGIRPTDTRNHDGVDISDIVAGSPADRAGLRIQARITHIEGKPTPDVASFMRVLEGYRPGNTIRLTVIDKLLSEELPKIDIAVALVDKNTKFVVPPVDDHFKEALEKVQRLGTRVEKDSMRPSLPVVGVWLYCSETTDDLMKSIAAFSDLQTLTLDDFGTVRSSLTVSGFTELKNLSKLKSLTLMKSEISVDSAKLISVLKQLESFNLSKAKIDSTGLEYLVENLKIRELVLRETDLHEEDFATLGKATSLKKLDLYKVNIDDAGYYRKHQHKAFLKIESLRNLTHLDLSFTNFDDDDAACLANLNNLEVLDLSHTLITDKALVHLSKMNRLRKLTLSYTRTAQANGDSIDQSQITANGLETSLKDLKSLRYLNVNASNRGFELKDIKRLGRLWPYASIYTSSGSIGPTEKAPPSVDK